ncbi:hypothetical protein [Sanguibacter sp. HDW7]|uniref:hypothetical protein n=1 Tax=Sanguibacter sp. HDW7 TaxID=2714931 RepID=UPI00140D0944|nr:hypothetical protein [Sanguibacter sp. HDW7]QIK83084.1 hypothetical protein G7063_05175 [Sanguibacter sp. HDW7]
MSPVTAVDDTAHQDVIRQVLADSRRVLDELGTLLDSGVEEHQVLDGLRRALADVERPPVPRSWHLDVGYQPVVVDHTCGLWPSVCADRWNLDTITTRLHYTCTRIANHTGRHAAGMHGVIVAVWEQDVPEVLDAVEGAV